MADKSFIVDDDIATLELTSSGMTGPEWFTYLSLHHHVGSGFEDFLNHEKFIVTDMRAYHVKILKGKLFEGYARCVEAVRNVGISRGLNYCEEEVGTLLRARLSNSDIEKMGLHSILIMLKPMQDAWNDEILMVVDRLGGLSWISKYQIGAQFPLTEGVGFAFLDAQDP